MAASISLIRRAIYLLTPAVALCGGWTFVDGATYEVGTGFPLETLAGVPWPTLAPGDKVLIHWRAEPYREKIVLECAGTSEAPIVIQGVSSSQGEMPVISGDNALNASPQDFPGDDRSIVKIGDGGASRREMPAHITLENLEIRSARAPYRFTRKDGSSATYRDYAAGVWVQKGSDITVRNCTLHDSANGLLSSPSTSRLTIEHCYIHGNGLPGSVLCHNTYTESRGVVFQFNRFGPLMQKSRGNALKDRSSGTVIRYNWIEGGSRLLDLVDSDGPAIRDDPAYRETYVYGNILLKPDEGLNNQICHYGGDSGDEAKYRQGTLFFYHNTVVSSMPGGTVLFRCSDKSETVEAANNILHATSPRGGIALSVGSGTLRFKHNWIKTGWKNSLETSAAKITADENNIGGSHPEFLNIRNEFVPSPTSPVSRLAGPLWPKVESDHPHRGEYLAHQQGRTIQSTAIRSAGALQARSESPSPMTPPEEGRVPSL